MKNMRLLFACSPADVQAVIASAAGAWQSMRTISTSRVEFAPQTPMAKVQPLPPAAGLSCTEASLPRVRRACQRQSACGLPQADCVKKTLLTRHIGLSNRQKPLFPPFQKKIKKKLFF